MRILEEEVSREVKLAFRTSDRAAFQLRKHNPSLRDMFFSEVLNYLKMLYVKFIFD